MSSKKIYLASSWRNQFQPELTTMLRLEGYEVYDFRNPSTGGPPGGRDLGFSWKQVNPNWGDGDILENYKLMLKHPAAQAGFDSDFNAMKWGDTCLLALPSGRSAHLEAGWMAGAGKKMIAYHPPVLCTVCGGTGTQKQKVFPCNNCDMGKLWNFEPELMYLIGGPDVIATSWADIVARLKAPLPTRVAEVLDPTSGGTYEVLTTEPYPMVNEKLRPVISEKPR